VALMGRNGAGKTTLLRLAAGLVEPLRGRVEGASEVALLPQRPGDMFVHERVGDELRGEEGLASLWRFGLEGHLDSDPRDLSGGERQRLALAIALAGRGPAGELPRALLLDEPTRGMDRARKRELAELAGSLSGEGTAVVIATHDVEFAATFAERVVLLGRGEVAADGGTHELLAGGWYFSSEVARILDGAAVTVEEGVALLRESAPRPGGKAITGGGPR
jgi:energy-coupling factor transport system ATP-binding protein